MKNKILVVFLVGSIFFLAGCTKVTENWPFNKFGYDGLHPVSSIAINEQEASAIADKVPIHLYFSDDKTSKLSLEVRYISIEEVKKSVSNIATVVVRELLKGPSQNLGLKALIPEGTNLSTNVTFDKGTAKVELSKDFADKFLGDMKSAELEIYSLVNSLTEIKEIEYVKIDFDEKIAAKYPLLSKMGQEFKRNELLINKKIADVSKQEVINEIVESDNELLE